MSKNQTDRLSNLQIVGQNNVLVPGVETAPTENTDVSLINDVENHDTGEEIVNLASVEKSIENQEKSEQF